MKKAIINVDGLQQLREEKGLDKAELARRAGISRPYLSQMESKKRTPSLEVATSIANALGCTVWDLGTMSDGLKQAGARPADHIDRLGDWLRSVGESEQNVVFTIAEALGFKK